MSRPDGPRIAVVGSGANGASIGADLVVAGHDVTLVEQWPEHVRAMRARGLRIRMPEREVRVAVRAHDLCEVATFTEPFDVVLVLMKAYDTRWACQLIEPHVAPDGLVVGVQNGMTADVVAEVVGRERALGAVIEVSSMLEVPGTVERHSPPDRSWFALGALADETRGREQEVAALLGCAGAVEVVDDIRAAKWMKLVSNATTLVPTALLGLPMVAALEVGGMRELMLAAGEEALAAGRALGHPPLPIFGLGPEDLHDEGGLVAQLLDVLYAGFVLPHTTTTVLHDWSKGRHSEVDDINGLVVATLGPERAPVNAAVVELAHRVERGALVPGRENVLALGERAAAAVG